MRRLHHMTICSEGVYYLVVMGVILTAALIRQINLLMVLYGVLAGPLLLSWGAVRRQVKRIDVVRRAPAAVTAGEPFTVEIELRNERKRGGSFALTIGDELERLGRGAKPFATSVYCSYLPAGESRRLTYFGLAPGRGVYDFQPLKLSSRFPLGLLKTMVRIDKPQRLLVFPKPGRLAPSWQRMLKADEGTGSGGRRQVGLHEGDFYGLREWRPGDARSRIHWRTTARRRALTVRQYERRCDVPLLLIVEFWEPSKPAAADRARTEAVASLIATVVAEACRDGGRTMQLHVIAKRPRRTGGPASAALLHDVRRLLAAVEPTDDDGLPSTLVAALTDVRPQTNVVVVSTRPFDLEDEERFAALHQRADLHSWSTRCLRLWPSGPKWSQVFREPDA